MHTSVSNKSANRDDYQFIARSIGAMPKEFAQGHHNLPHTHDRDQLIYASHGIMQIKSQHKQWILSPEMALLIPHHVEHEMTALSDVSLRTLFIHPNVYSHAGIKMVHVGTFLKELILKAMTFPIEYDEHGIDGKVMDLIVHEIHHNYVEDFALPIVTHPKLQSIEQEAMHNTILLTQTIDDWAKHFHCSSKTLSRLIQKELGMGFQLWMQLLTVKISLVKMAQHEPLTQIAYDLGYASLASFSRMFKKTTGQSPSQMQSVAAPSVL